MSVSRDIPVAGGTPTEPGWYAAVMKGTSGLICVRVYKEPHNSFPSDMFVKYDLHEFNLDDFEWGQSIDDLQDVQAALVGAGFIGTVDGVQQLVELRRQAEAEVEHLSGENAKLQSALAGHLYPGDAAVEHAHWAVGLAADRRGNFYPEHFARYRAIVEAYPVNPGLPSPLKKLRVVLAKALEQEDGDEQEFIEKCAADDFERWGIGPRNDEDVPTWADRIRAEAIIEAAEGPTT